MWDVGLRDAGTCGCRDVGTWGLRDVGREHTQGLEDKGHRDWRT